ncbi:MAG: hypothetical protein JSV07_09320, partial [Acidimicrobiia bacterium]
TKTLLIEPLTFDVFDPETNAAAGTATSGAEITITGENESGWFRVETPVIADQSGNWDATELADYWAGGWTQAHIADDDGDRTVAWPAGPPPEPQIRGNPEADYIEGWNFDVGTSVVVEVTGMGAAFSSTAIVEDHGWAGVFGLWTTDESFDLLPGHTVTVTGTSAEASATKELLVEELTFDTFDPVGNVVAGTAASGTEVRVNGGNDSYDFEEFATADEFGDWSINLGDIGFDLTFDMGGEASIDDEDGDSTVARSPEWASFIVNEAHDFIHGSGFGVGAPIAFAINDGVADVYSGTTTTDDEGNFGIGVEFDIGPGHIVTVTGPEGTKDLVVDLLRFDTYDPEGNFAAGTATSGALISVYGENEAGWFRVDLTADTSGAWEVSGDEVDFWVDGWTHVRIRDVDGDSTLDWEPAPATIQVDPTTDSVVGQEFEAGTTVRIEIDRGGLVYSGTAIVETGPWGGWTGFGVDLAFDILPGDRVTVTGTTVFKAVVVQALTFDEYDPSLNTAAGTAPAHTWLSVYGDGPLGGFELEVQADSGGNWTASGADFPAAGEGWMVVALFDADGDSTAVQPPYPEP